MKTVISNLSRGEFGPQLYGRVDIPQYGAGAKSLRNWVVQRYGGAAFRTGLRYVFDLPTDKDQRLIPFQYSIEQAYMQVLGDSEMRLAAAGAMVTEDNLKITAATNAAQGQFTIAYHDMAIGDKVFLSGLTGAWAVLNGRFASVVAVPSANVVTLDVNTTTLGAFTSSDGITRTVAPTAPPTPEPPPAAPPPEPEPPATSTLPWWKGGLLV